MNKQREIKAASAPTHALHLFTPSSLSAALVSPASRWTDDHWHFENPVPGAHRSASTIAWNVEVRPGESLLDRRHADLLNWMRRFAWSLFFAPGNNASPLAPGSAAILSSGLRHLARWMVANEYTWPSQLDSSALDNFKNDLSVSLADELDEEGGISLGQAAHRIRPIVALWQQRDELAAAGIEPLPQIPWGGRGAMELAKEISSKAHGYIRPLPDEVAIRVINAAEQFLSTPADDIIRLQTLLENIQQRPSGGHHTGPGTSSAYKARLMNDAISKFKFSRKDSSEEPWLQSIRSERDTEERLITPIQRVRQLILAVQHAAVIAIQAGAGMRISEVCGLGAGIDAATGLPRCVSVSESFTGLNEIFLVRSFLSKMEESPREVEWLVGMRPKGSDYLPLTVRAIIVLDRLLEPYRALCGSDRLIVGFNNLRGLPRTGSSISPANSERLLRGMREFVRDWAMLDRLPDESEHPIEEKDLLPYKTSRGQILRSHQFRKFYANFAFSVDSRLLPAVQMHFRHLSQAMTEGHYWGANQLQIEPLPTTQRQQTALLMYELATGKALVAGRMGDQLSSHLDQLRNIIVDRGRAAAWQAAINFVFEYDLRLWFAPHGKCLPLVPANMRCHRMAGTSSWLNKEPNYETREPSVCAGCSSFVLDSRHRQFWEERFITNWASYRAAEKNGLASAFRVVRDRAAQARALLSAIGVDAESLILHQERSPE